MITLHYFCANPNCNSSSTVHIYRYDFINTFRSGIKPNCSECAYLMSIKHMGSNLFTMHKEKEEDKGPQKTLDTFFGD